MCPRCRDQIRFRSNPNQPRKKFVGFHLEALTLLALVTASVILNWLDDFLHAPIGIKDYPLEPGIVVQLARLAWIPLFLSALLFGFLGIMSRAFKTVPLLLGTAIVSFGGISLVGGILGEHKGTELFHGQAYFSQTVTPVLYILFLVVGRCRCIRLHREMETRTKAPTRNCGSVPDNWTLLGAHRTVWTRSEL